MIINLIGKCFFSHSLRNVYVDIGNKAFYAINSDKIKNISLYDHKRTLSNEDKAKNKNDNVHLHIYSNNSKLHLEISNCEKINFDIVKKTTSNLNLKISALRSNINFDNSLNSSNLSISLSGCDKSKIAFKSINNLHNLTINKSSLSSYTMNSLSCESFAFYLNDNDILKCCIHKITNNSILEYKNQSNIKMKINPIALFALINIYDVNLRKFINLPLGVLGGKIGSTSFPTLLLKCEGNAKSKINFKMKMIPNISFKYLFAFSFFTMLILLPTINKNEMYKYRLYRKYLNKKIKDIINI